MQKNSIGFSDTVFSDTILLFYFFFNKKYCLSLMNYLLNHWYSWNYEDRWYSWNYEDRFKKTKKKRMRNKISKMSKKHLILVQYKEEI